jgi:hypothetical protein
MYHGMRPSTQNLPLAGVIIKITMERRGSLDLELELQRIYDSEINVQIGWF